MGDLGATLGGIALIAFLIGGVFFIIWSFMRQKEAVRGGAALLGLPPGEPPEGGEDWDVKECYGGTCEGVALTIALGSKVVPAGGTAAYISGLLIEARPPSPSSFSWTIQRKAGIIEGNMEHPDPEFNAACAVTTDDPAKALALLDDAGLRRRVAAFLAEGQGSARLAHDAAFLVMFDSHFKGPEGVAARARGAAALARELGERASRL